MILIDTDILTLLFYGNPRVRERRLAAPLSEFITTVTRAEMLRGRLDGLLKATMPDAIIQMQSRLQQTEEFLTQFRVIPLDGDAAARFAELRRTKAARNMDVPDLLNACIALLHDAVLVTRNTKDYSAIPGLKLENWAD
ncbi:type II toxin-antitoxin system VapC family toxin [Gemmata sp.]|uniref:type II toxin-antitoxin system VapC family toxin n=1 Tax=Gemmata sp. TaxID=1914242 RepID=UPI003F72B577